MRIVLLVAVLLLVAAAVVVAMRSAAERRRRSERLRVKFGPEYDRAVQGAGGRKQAERELRERTSRHAQLELRPLSEPSRERYRSRWTAVQAHFVDAPDAALGDADGLLAQLLQERGYPSGTLSAQEELLSVQHARVLQGFRAGHAVQQDSAAGRASTEQIRQAMLQFRDVFEELLDDEGGSRRVGPR